MNEMKELRFTLLLFALLIITSMVISVLTVGDRELMIDEMEPLHEDVNFVDTCKGIC